LTPSFAELGVPAALTARLRAHHVAAPFPIQAATLPDALAGRDVCGRAPTGSGKTLAFGLALVARVSKARPRRPTALVLVPTRELAAQVERELAWIGGGEVRSATIYGGVGYEPQRRALNRGVEVVVACPGRLEDLIASGALTLDSVEVVVLDEADRMADMGFVPAVRRILDTTPATRQTLLFSATLDGEVDDLVRRYQRKPSHHHVAGSDADRGDVEHRFWRVERANRLDLVASLVASHGRSIVFCRTKRGTDRLAKQLNQQGVRSVPLHGDRSQAQRDRAIAAFTSGSAQVLVATDVAARGIHADDVECVVHYDPPADEKDYVHRSGRTGRAGADGVVVTLVHDEVRKAVAALQRALGVPQRLDDPAALEPAASCAPHIGVAAAKPDSVVKAVPGRKQRQRRAQHTGRPAGRPQQAARRAERTQRGDREHAPPARTGTVKFFDARRGFGFIERTGHDDVFVHTSAVASSGLRKLETGQRVSFELEQGRNGHEAQRIRLL
jgi:superfamily II DNA/RNA helicase